MSGINYRPRFAVHPMRPKEYENLLQKRKDVIEKLVDHVERVAPKQKRGRMIYEKKYHRLMNAYRSTMRQIEEMDAVEFGNALYDDNLNPDRYIDL